MAFTNILNAPGKKLQELKENSKGQPVIPAARDVCCSQEERRRLSEKVKEASSKDFSNQKSLGSMNIDEFKASLFGK